jgi:hypothetical protein
VYQLVASLPSRGPRLYRPLLSPTAVSKIHRSIQ